jgi:pilus assembly protein Flp/PilA
VGERDASKQTNTCQRVTPTARAGPGRRSQAVSACGPAGPFFFAFSSPASFAKAKFAWPVTEMNRMNGIKAMLNKATITKIWRDETGGEVIEYALILGLILVACIAIIGAVGTKVFARWTSVNSSM